MLPSSHYPLVIVCMLPNKINLSKLQQQQHLIMLLLLLQRNTCLQRSARRPPQRRFFTLHRRAMRHTRDEPTAAVAAAGKLPHQ